MSKRTSSKNIFGIFLVAVLVGSFSATTFAQKFNADGVDQRVRSASGKSTEVSKADAPGRKLWADGWRYTSRGWYQLGHINGSVVTPTRPTQIHPLSLAGIEIAVAFGLLFASWRSPRGIKTARTVRCTFNGAIGVRKAKNQEVLSS